MNKPRLDGLYYHVDTNKVYNVYKTDVINNSDDGKLMVAYMNVETRKHYVREKEDFFSGKFKAVDSYDMLNKIINKQEEDK